MPLVRFEQLTSAEPGWRAVFREPDGAESQSRILGWAVLGDGGELVGVVVDPAEPSSIVPAPNATSPAGGTFVRYRFVPPEPIVVPAPAPASTPAPAQPETSEQIAKSLLKRRR